MELLTTLPVGDEAAAINVIVGYLSRWSVEETYRFLKSSSKLEQLQVRSLSKLQNLVAACFIATSLLARMARCESGQRIIEYSARRQKKAPPDLYNWLYRTADAIALIVKRHISAIRLLNAAQHPNWRKRLPYPPLIPLQAGL